MKCSADRLYVGTVAAVGMFHAMVRTIAPLYAVKEAGLGPLELALAGARRSGPR